MNVTSFKVSFDLGLSMYDSTLPELNFRRKSWQRLGKCTIGDSQLLEGSVRRAEVEAGNFCKARCK